MLGSHNFIIKGLAQNRKSYKFVGLPYSKSLHCTMAQGLKKSGINEASGAFAILFFNEIPKLLQGDPEKTLFSDLCSSGPHLTL